MEKSYLITGGARSGKSAYAQELAEEWDNPYYVATAWVGKDDTEMQSRVAKHIADRGPKWGVIEEQIDLSRAIIQAQEKGADCILVDCLTTWTTNMMFNQVDINQKVSELQELIKEIKIPLVIVSNEVGMGIVPETALGREFRDLAGIVNQKVAKTVDKVIFMVSGLPMTVK